MTLAVFNTLKVANRLKAVGVPPAQAEAEAEVFLEIFEFNLKELATKEDVRLTKEALQQEIGSLRKDMDIKFANIDAKFLGLEERFNARLDKLTLQLAFRLSAVTIGTLTVLSLLPKVFLG